MFVDRIEDRWIAAFEKVFSLCKIRPGESVAILSETQSRQINVHLAELALLRMKVSPFHLVIPTPPQSAPVPVRSTGASHALQQNARKTVQARQSWARASTDQDLPLFKSIAALLFPHFSARVLVSIL